MPASQHQARSIIRARTLVDIELDAADSDVDEYGEGRVRDEMDEEPADVNDRPASLGSPEEDCAAWPNAPSKIRSSPSGFHATGQTSPPDEPSASQNHTFVDQSSLSYFGMPTFGNGQ